MVHKPTDAGAPPVAPVRGAAVPVPVPPPVPVVSTAVPSASTDAERVALEKECDALAQQGALAPQYAKLMQERQALQQQYEAAASADNFEAVGMLGQRLKLMKVTPLPLSEQDYATLGSRVTALIQRVTVKCRALMAAEDFPGVASLGAKLSALKALNVSALPGQAGSSGAAAPVAGKEEEDAEWANDPVYVPPNGEITTQTAGTH